MIRTALVAAMLCLGLTACNQSTTGALTSAVNSASFAKFVQIAQAAARVTCSVTPTAASIAALVSASPLVTTASQAAALACGALAAQPVAAYSADDGQAPKVEGVAVTPDGKVVPVEGVVEKPKPADRTLAKKAPGSTPENAR